MNAYIELEIKYIWAWQIERYIKDGWHFCDYCGFCRIKIERCIG